MHIKGESSCDNVLMAWAIETVAPRSNLRADGVIFVVGIAGIFLLEVLAILEFQSINTSRDPTSPSLSYHFIYHQHSEKPRLLSYLAG
jgi:hypothetical protein